jgi:hypothetical protein
MLQYYQKKHDGSLFDPENIQSLHSQAIGRSHRGSENVVEEHDQSLKSLYEFYMSLQPTDLGSDYKIMEKIFINEFDQYQEKASEPRAGCCCKCCAEMCTNLGANLRSWPILKIFCCGCCCKKKQVRAQRYGGVVGGKISKLERKNLDIADTFDLSKHPVFFDR